jgi:hypothetical protein
MPVTVTRYNKIFHPDPSRVIARFLYMGDERSLSIVRKVLEMSEDEVKLTLGQVLRGFSKRHRNISKIFEKHFNQITNLFEKLDVKPEDIDMSRKVLIGSYLQWNIQ